MSPRRKMNDFGQQGLLSSDINLAGRHEDNYELKYLRLENQKLREQLENQPKKMDKNMEKDIATLLQISIRMKGLLEMVRSQVMIPIDLGKHIDNVIKEIDNYG